MKIILFCFVIFFTRLIDTTLGTLRTITTVKNQKSIATIIAFIETIIWLVIFKESIDPNNFSIVVVISYSLGFALGTYIGMIIIEKYSTIYVSVNIICKKNKKLVNELINNGYSVSVVKIMGKELIGNKFLIIIGTTSKRVTYIKEIVNAFEKNAFITINENKKVYNGYYL